MLGNTLGMVQDAKSTEEALAKLTRSLIAKLIGAPFPAKLARIVVVAVTTLVSVSPARAEFAMLSEDLTVYYEQAGNGPQTIVFIPGWTMSSRVFERQLAHFAGSTRYRAIAYDPRGQGLSSKLLSDYTYQQHGRDLGALIRKLGLKDVVLVGWSFGTFDMLAYLQASGTANVKAVVLLDLKQARF